MLRKKEAIGKLASPYRLTGWCIVFDLFLIAIEIHGQKADIAAK